jgi:hypothetical protein
MISGNAPPLLFALTLLGCLTHAGNGPTDRYLHLVVRVAQDGTAELVSATELAGSAVISRAATGDFVIEAADGGRTLSVEAVPDPFEGHGYGGPPGSPQGHFSERLESATLGVKVPGAGIDSDLDDLRIHFWRVAPATELHEIDGQILDRLKQEGRLREVASLYGPDLAREIRRLGRRVESAEEVPAKQ